MVDKHIKRTGDDYGEALGSLLPQGPAWPRRRDSVVMRVVRGLSQIWGLFETNAAKLLEIETDPRITLDMLPDWERNFGLPDDCYAEPQSIGERQLALVTRMTIEGAQSRAFFIEQALAIGYTITITEYRPFMCGIDRCGDNRQIGGAFDQFGWPLFDPSGHTPPDSGEYSEYPYMLGPPENRFYWTVHVGAVRLVWFRCGGGGGVCGVDPHLIIGIATDLECLLNRWKPGHTQIIFDYSGLGTPDPMAGTP